MLKRTRLAAAFLAAAIMINMAAPTVFALEETQQALSQPVSVAESVAAPEEAPASSEAVSSSEASSSSEAAAIASSSDAAVSSDITTSSSSAEDPSSVTAEEQTNEEDIALLNAGALTVEEVKAELGQGNYTYDDAKKFTYINLNDSKDTILVSNLDAEQYSEAAIKYSDTSGDITGKTNVLGTDYYFVGFGSDTAPFRGSFTSAVSGEKSVTLNHSLFNAISNKANFDVKVTLNWRGGNSPVFAEKVIFDTASVNPSWGFSLQNKESDGVLYPIGGLVGDVTKAEGIADGTLTLTSDLSKTENLDISTNGVSRDGDAGLICGSLGAGLTLDITKVILPTTAYPVTSTTGNAGGLVGSMASGATLTGGAVALNGITVTGATSASAGGIVGYAVNPAFTFTSVSVTDSTISGATNVGGLVGSVTDGTTVTIGNTYTVTGNTLTPAAGGNAGGLFGMYTAAELNNTLTISGISPSSKLATPDTYYGGLIGQVGASTYVKIDTVSETTTSTSTPLSFGGITAKANMGSVLDVNDISVNGRYTVNIKVAGYGGGLVGEMTSGAVLRLSGVTTLNGLNANDADVRYGQFVGKQDSSLIYYENYEDLTNYVKRSSGITVDDIGNYGEVIRNSNINLLIKFDTSTHAVTLDSSKVTNSNYLGDITLANKQEFAALAIAIQSRDVFSVDKANSANLLSKKITMTADISLENTGLIGLTRDNGDDTFTGTFDGNSKKLTLDIGKAYGTVIGTTTSTTTQGVIYRHGYLGLFGKTNNAIIKNLTVNGAITAATKLTTGMHIGIVAYATGTVNFTNVTSSFKSSNLESGGNALKYGGLIGRLDANGGEVIITGCAGNNIATNSGTNDFVSGNLVGFIKTTAATTFTLTNNTITGSVTSNTISPNLNWTNIGGVFGKMENTTSYVSTVHIDGLSVNSFNITAYTGSLLGYVWQNVDATLTNVNVTGSTLDLTKDTKNFGGLLYEATGRIKIVKGTTGVSIQNSTFKGAATNDITDAMLVCQGANLYLSVPIDAYTLTNNTITLSNTNNYFDELVGNTTPTASTGGIVSITTKTVDAKTIDTGSTCDTYVNQTKNGTTEWVNPNARYYYNLENIFSGQNLTDGTVNTPEELMLWSVLHYAAIIKDNKGTITFDLRKYIYSETLPTQYNITGTIDMSGYSYYPVNSSDTNINNATITFDNKTIETAETNNKPTTSNTSQHRGMQSGLFRDVSGTLNVSNLTLIGNIGKVTPSNTTSGALIAGTASVSTTAQTAISLANITLQDLYVNGAANNDADNAPLLINKISSYTTLTVSDLKTAAASGGTYAMNSQDYAAGTLIGDVGDKTATRIVLSFSKIKLDARTTEGVLIPAYATTKSIFYNATLLNQFMYTSESSGTYNFNEEEDYVNAKTYNVTYGKEITSSKRNVDKQRQYYNTENYVHPTDAPNTTNNGTEFNSYLPYVHKTQVTDSNLTTDYKEIDVNIKIGNLLVGCGTYGHPYEIGTATQLDSLYKFFLAGNSNGLSNWVVVYNENKTFCIGDAANDVQYCADGNGKWNKGAYNSTTNTFDVDTTTPKAITDATMLAYLRDAYYEVVNDITVTKTFKGLGVSTTSQAFRGVIVGKNSSTTETPSYPTITIPAEVDCSGGFGGLINVSYGSVVKNLNINYAAQASVPSATNTTTTVYFGGAIGDIEGGDSIIDNVNVTYADGVKLTGDNTNLITVGGYIGIIKAGGVVFKNMQSTYTGLTAAYKDAATININAEASDTSYYYYANPYIGRVLGGFAVYQGTNSTAEVLANTDKNYKIPTLTTTADKMSFSAFEKPTDFKAYHSTVSINNEQSLLIFSMITQSGAGTYDGTSTTSYQETDKNSKYNSNAYTFGKVRNANYDRVGDTTLTSSVDEYTNSQTDDEISTASATLKYSYIITNYVDDANNGKNAARRLTSTNVRYSMSLANSGKYDLSSYGNGFRGINMRYLTAAENLYTVMPLLGMQGNNSSIQVNMNVHQYKADTYKVTAVGFFNWFVQNNNGSLEASGSLYEASDLTLIGSVQLIEHDATGKDTSSTSTESLGVGGFAGSIYKATANQGIRVRIKNIKLGNGENNSLTVSGLSGAGGLIGSDSISSSMILTDCSADNLYVTGTYNTAGIIAYSSQTLTITNSENSPAVIENMTIRATGTVSSETTHGVGGIIGKLDDSKTKVDISNIKIANSKIYSASVTDYVTTATKINAGSVVGISSSQLALTNLDIYASSGKTFEIYSGGYAGGLAGYISVATTADGCKINSGDSADGKMLITGKSRIGGAFGSVGNNGCIFKNGSIGKGDSYGILIYGGSTGGILGGGGNSGPYTVSTLNSAIKAMAIYNKSASGGVVGDSPGAMIVEVRDFVIEDSAIVTSDSSGNGGLIGKLNNALIGSNILWKNNLIEQCNDALGKNAIQNWLSGTALTITKNNINQSGTWVGSIADTKADFVQLSGVQKISTSASTPVLEKDAGNVSAPFNDNLTSDSFIVYADYMGVQDATGGGVSPYVTGSPYSGVTLYKADGTEDVKLVGDAAVFADDAKTTAMATKTKTDNTNKVTTAYTANTVENFVFSTNIETYEKYIKAGTTTTVKLPVFVVDKNDTGSVNTMVTAYLNLLTNGGYSKALTASAVTAEAISYQWNDTRSRFEAVDAASMAYNNKTFSVASGRYDNNKNQFTLLNVTFGGTYVMQVPVMVKKIVEVKLDVSMLNSAVFNQERFDINKIRLLAGFGEKFTMQLTYSYYYLWSAYLSSGGTLLWGYDKTVDFNQALPSGTKLTLVDANNKDSAYKATLGSAAASINLSSFVSVSDNTAWSPTNLNDRLNITVTPADNGAWIKTTEGATLTDGTDGYRLWTEKDVDAARYTVAFNNDEMTDGTDPVKERYYLLVETPEKNGTSGININITSALSSTSPNSLPNKMTDMNDMTDEEKEKASGLIDTAISHILSDNSGGTAVYKKLNSTGDTVTIKLTDKIECSGGYAHTLPDTANRHLQFGVNLNQISNTGSSSFIPPVTANVTFRILDAYDKEINFSNVSNSSGTSSGTSKQYNTNISAETPELTFIFGSNNTPNAAFNLVNLLKKYNAGQTGDNAYFKVEATIELLFSQKAMAVFPQHTDAEVTGNKGIPPSYTNFNSNARISSNASALISGIKKDAIGKIGYYRGEEAGAKLDYNAVGNISQLGINVSNLENNTGTHVIETQGVYDISTADNKEELISKAEKLVCNVTLSHKDGNGAYVPVTNPNSYITISGAGSSSDALTWEIVKGDGSFGGIYDPTQGTFALLFDVNVATDIETLDGTYANYQVTLEVKLVGTSETELNTASDYFKYTLARVSTEILRPAT